jgi:16S rRNA (cytidine1402-2'-O)-methyltransferase
MVQRTDPASTCGVLLLVSTPIGNLSDLSPRAAEALESAGTVLAEDTRHSSKLIPPGRRIVSYHDHNATDRQPLLKSMLEAGSRVALVTDAGTPGISDPCYRAVQTAIECGARIEVIPGPCAAIAALVGSGLPVDRFCFEGFLPRRKGHRTRRLAEMEPDWRTMIFYAGPHHLLEILRDMLEVFGDRKACVARELTKMHEEYVRGTLSELVAKYTVSAPRGEITLVVAGAPRRTEVD